ncbi:hypothetical protein ACGYLO_11980 [Sulfitobacter sp. 1A13353]|uniref:hypothetical protein n=1 Tax=Sulfitobacter sp. 1A13353 TaxID=3368568 RepID=UPI0037455AF4
MSGNQIDFKKLINKARCYPDMATWRMEHPASYYTAAEHNIIERPEISRHMDLELRARVTFDDVLNDLRFYTSQRSWRDRSPVNFWAAWANGWLSHPDVEACVPNKLASDRLWSFEKVCDEARNFKDMESWRVGHRPSYQAAKRNLWLGQPKLLEVLGVTDTAKFSPAEILIENPRLLISSADISKSPDPDKTRDDLQQAVSDGRLYEIDEDLYVKGHLRERAPNLLPEFIANAMARELGWHLKPSCEQMAYEFGMPHLAKRRMGFESDERSMRVDLCNISRKGHPMLLIRKVPRYRMELGDNYEDRLLRALMAVPQDKLDQEVDKAIDKLTGAQLLVLRISLRGISGPVRRSIERSLR